METQKKSQTPSATILIIALVLLSPVMYRTGTSSESAVDLFIAPFFDPIALKIILIPTTLVIAFGGPLAMFLDTARGRIALASLGILLTAYIVAFTYITLGN